MNIPTYEGENSRANTGSKIVINDLVTVQGDLNHKVKITEAKMERNDETIVKEDGVKVHNQNKMLCDAVKRLNPHVFSMINDVTTELLSPVEEAGQLSM